VSWYVKRSTDYGYGWTGPIRSARQAERERDAWQAIGRNAEVVESTPAVRAEVRAWERQRRAERSA
jgi:hypothetical protein